MAFFTKFRKQEKLSDFAKTHGKLEANAALEERTKAGRAHFLWERAPSSHYAHRAGRRRGANVAI